MLSLQVERHRPFYAPPTNVSTNLKGVDFSVNYEFDKPRDYTIGAYTTADFPRPRGRIVQVVTLPDSQFLGHRVRGRRRILPQTGTKDFGYQATYVDSLAVRGDYYIKNVVAKALTTASFIDLLDTDLQPFSAMLSADNFAVSYNRYGYTTSLSYSRRTAKPQPIRTGWGNRWGLAFGN